MLNKNIKKYIFCDNADEFIKECIKRDDLNVNCETDVIRIALQLLDATITIIDDGYELQYINHKTDDTIVVKDFLKK